MQRQEPSRGEIFVEIVGGYHELVQGSLNYIPRAPKSGQPFEAAKCEK